MNEHKIPDDLREDYDDFAEASNSPMEGGWRYYARTLIERIARVEAERDEAREQYLQLTDALWAALGSEDRRDYVEQVKELRAALARMQGPVTDAEIDTMAREYAIDLVLSAGLAVAVDALLAARAGMEKA